LASATPAPSTLTKASNRSRPASSTVCGRQWPRTRDSFSDSIGSVLALAREIDETSLVELETVLLAADIGSTTAREIIERLRQRGLRQGIEGGDELKRLLKLELKAVLDAVATEDAVPAVAPEIVMMVGVNGTGKTTTTGKLAAYYVAQGRSVLLCAADTFRAAPSNSFEVWAARSDVPIIKTKNRRRPVGCALRCMRCGQGPWRRRSDRRHGGAPAYQDRPDERAGQDASHRRAAGPGAPHQTLLVMDATTGQNGLQQARLFTDASRVTGIVLTKLDGTAKVELCSQSPPSLVCL
jgi:fused signal recognition particle receptor